MYSGGGGAGGGGGGGTGVGGATGLNGVTGGQQGSGWKVQTGLNPSRNRGFGSGTGVSRLETPSLNDMRAKQGAIVAKFMTFFRRKCSLVIEMYETSFYRQKPNWDRIADFIYKDLCNTPELRKAVQDVQFHPVKMLLFIRFSEEQLRDDTVTRLQSAEGVIWTDYKVKVKGYSLDAQVKFIRLLGVSPETKEEDIKETFMEVGIGEIVEIKKGLLDAGRLPGVTNGTWTLRVKILDPDMIIPSYIHRRDEGELWSLNFEGRVFCCWKCGSGNHIGDKCRDQTRTVDEIFQGVNDDGENVAKPTWAAVVRSGQAETEEQRSRLKEMEKKLKIENMRKDKESKDLEEKRIEDENVVERQKQRDAEVRQRALAEVAAQAQQAMEDAEVRARHSNVQVGEVMEDSGLKSSVDECTDAELLQAADISEKGFGNVSGVLQVHDSVAELGERARLTARQHLAWLEQRSAAGLVGDQMSFTLHPDLERIFGDGATRLAIQFEGSNLATEPVSIGGEDPENSSIDEEVLDWSQNVEEAEIEEDEEDDDADKPVESGFKASTPKKKRKKRRRRGKSGSSSSSVNSVAENELKADGEGELMTLGSSFNTSGSDQTIFSDSVVNESKKPRLEEFVEGLGSGLNDSPGNSVHLSGDGILPGDNLAADLSVKEGDGSSHEDEMSSGVTRDTIQPGDPGKDGMGEV